MFRRMSFKKKTKDVKALIYMILLIVLFSDENSMVKGAVIIPNFLTFSL